MLENYIQFVKDQATFHEQMAARFGPESKHPSAFRVERHTATSAKFLELATALQASIQTPPAGGASKSFKPRPLSLSFDEIEGLPQELLQELSISDGDRTDYAILRAIEDAGGIASLDRILLGLYKQTGEILKRATLTSRIYRMSQKELLFPVQGRKGVYSIDNLTPEQVQLALDSN